MTVFKTFLKVLKSCKIPIILYTVLLIVFGGVNTKTEDNSMSFTASKPDVLVINNDKNEGITKNLVEYIEKNSNIANIENNEDAINDAIFYRDVNYVIYIPENFNEEFLAGKNPELKTKSTGDYYSSLAEMMVERYIKVANIYVSQFNDEEEIIKDINETLDKQAKIEITSKLDTDSLYKATRYFDFANYTILAGCIYIICLILSSFRAENIKRRTMVSSTNYKKFNRKLLISNSLFAIVLWLFYVIVGIILIGDIMLTNNGIILIVNSFVFTISALTLGFCIGNMINNKNAVNGIVNVVSLGTSFLCGSFVPAQYLPDFVLKIAHIFPSYYYIHNNELVGKLEVINIETLKPILINMGIMLVFSIIFVILSNIFSKKKS